MSAVYATVAQQVEQLTRNEQVVRSNRISSSKKNPFSFENGFFFVSFTVHSPTKTRRRRGAAKRGCRFPQRRRQKWGRRPQTHPAGKDR